jgi:uncharacterized protein YciI
MGEAPPGLQGHTIVLLRRPPDAPEFSDDELERLQAGHLGHLRAMRERGVLAVAGPFGDQQDQALRGLCIYTVGLDEARRLAAEDPSVQAGRMAAQAFTWYAPAGEVSFGPAPGA